MQESLVELCEDILDCELDIRIKVSGKSMSPFLKDGETVTVRKARGSSLHVGDIVLFRDKYGFPVLHRLIKRKKIKDSMLLFTKGDALRSFDLPVQEENILGRVSVIERGNSFIYMDSITCKILNPLIAYFHLLKTHCYHVYLKLKKQQKILMRFCEK